jgi:hypothetical protein
LTDRFRNWGQLIGLIAAGLLSFGALKMEAAGLRRDMEKKAERETVTAQYQAILQRLDAIDRKLEAR